jgi:hypothetical protein
MSSFYCSTYQFVICGGGGCGSRSSHCSCIIFIKAALYELEVLQRLTGNC